MRCVCVCACVFERSECVYGFSGSRLFRSILTMLSFFLTRNIFSLGSMLCVCVSDSFGPFFFFFSISSPKHPHSHTYCGGGGDGGVYAMYTIRFISFRPIRNVHIPWPLVNGFYALLLLYIPATALFVFSILSHPSLSIASKQASKQANVDDGISFLFFYSTCIEHIWRKQVDW